MSPPEAGEVVETRERVLDELRLGERFVLVTHENPDGDALGSLVAMHRVLTSLGKDSVMLMSADEFPLPYEYRFFDLDGMQSHPPEDVEERTAIFLDCGNIDRNPWEVVKGEGMHILNLDHHHDNTRFADINHVVPEASSTAEVVWDLMHDLGVEPTRRVAEGLYVGLVTDTGRFMYTNTGVRAHVMAAELVAAGVNVHEIFRRLYEGMPEPKVALLARALDVMERYDGGRLTYVMLGLDDFARTGAQESYTEGIIDHLRAIDGTKVAALTRSIPPVDRGTPRAKVSLRATDGEVDVSAIARAGGGGGHRQAAGFTTELEPDEIVAFLREQIAAQLASTAH
jgi:bifunctional oligoribonuclease and PAP phosphatase NrnA